jgi:hypothetical protein
MRFNRAVESGHRPRRHERADRGAPDGGGTKVFQQVWHRRVHSPGTSALGRHERARGEHRHSMGRFDDWPNTTERLIGNVMRFYLKFQGAPLATIDAKEIHKADDEYLAGKWASA